jgi:uncharacterized protein YyaL (SSP411 family)
MTDDHLKENRLKNSASPYLRSASHQPIDWHEWGDDAFAAARAADKPILLDIGAVWCHWCHVIDRESYENPAIAELINQFYIPVKVDRDERPDVDSRYQSAISAISGQGGWPLTAFLTPDGKPFFGGTYFPPEDAMGRPGFRRILTGIAEAYKSRRADVDSSAKALEEAVAKAEIFQGARGAFDVGIVDSVIEPTVSMFDEVHGGFGSQPKFPHASAVDLLLETFQAQHTPRLLHVAERTLKAMAMGGVYDQVAGGFHRYSVDERWVVPHFEKMSYDNSELLRNYLHGILVTRDPELSELFIAAANGIITWVNSTLSDQAKGGFFGSQDADQTLDDDGDYFTWTRDEVNAVLTRDEALAIQIYYDVEAYGEMHHHPAKNVLWITSSFEELGRKLGIDAAAARSVIERAKAKMLAARLLRQPTPAIDETIYVSWNAMFISAYLEAARVLKRPELRAFALKTLDRIIAEAWDNEKGFGHRVGGPRLEGSLDDQVFAAAALLDAYEATLDPRYFQIAERAVQLAVTRYGDPEAGGFFDRPRDAAPMGGLEVRRKPMQDSPTPGANSVAVMVLDRLHGFTGETLYREWAEKTLECFVNRVPQYGLFAATYGLAAVLHARHPLQVVVLGAENDPAAAQLEDAAHKVYRFGKAVLRVTPEILASAVAALPPALRETLPHLDPTKAQALVCVETTCHPPTSDPAKLKALLLEVASSPASA